MEVVSFYIALLIVAILRYYYCFEYVRLFQVGWVPIPQQISHAPGGNIDKIR